MKSLRNRWSPGALVAAIALALPLQATADAMDADDGSYDALKAQVEALQKQLQQVQEALKQYEAQSASKQEVAEIKQDVAEVTATTSEWKNAESVVHLAGYGSVTYSDSNADDINAAFSGVQFSPIFHYQYKDLVMLESELEITAEDDGSTDTELEYMTIDLFINDYLAAVGGKFLSPLGQFRQNYHPSWINKLPTAPPGFGHDQAAPVSEVGLEARGGFPLGGDSRFANYAVYVGNGPILEIGEEDGEFEIEAIEAEGRTSNDDDRFVFGGRFGVLPVPMLEIGLSGATGEVAGKDEPSATRDYDVYGADLTWTWNDLRILGEYIKQKVGSESSSVAPDSLDWESWYAQAAYRFMPTKWEGVVRYGDYDSPHNDQDQRQWALGINYVFAPNAIAKFAYNFNDGESGTDANEDGFQIQLAYGF
ncbi:MAG: porin [Gammaproteobacteria bacterium]|jgi:hypothetical protein